MTYTNAAARVSAQTAYGLRYSAALRGFSVREFNLRPFERLEPHHHDLPVLVAVLEGSYEQQFGGVRVECTAGTTVVVPGGERHSERVGGQGAHSLLITPTPRMGRSLSSEADWLGTFSYVGNASLTQLARRLQASFSQTDPLSELERECLALDLAVSLARTRVRRKARSAAAPPWLERARELLDDRYAESISLSAVAAEFGVSTGHLARCFRKRFGASVGEYVRARRLEAAERLLSTTREPITRVAFLAGFCDQSHLGKAFRRRYGRTPASYRDASRH